MLLQTEIEKKSKHVKFVSYTGKYPSLCEGTLTLEIYGKVVTFGRFKNADYLPFWKSGGYCDADNTVYENQWIIDEDLLPKKFRKYALEIDREMNWNVSLGCCGGCAVLWGGDANGRGEKNGRSKEYV